MIRRTMLLGALAIGAAGVGCGGGGSTHGAAGEFDGARAYRLAELQVSYGPRPAGSRTQRRVAAILRPLLPHGRFEKIPGGLRNIVGELPGREPAIVVGAHYDTTPVPGYLGANNSATGVGAVIELARQLARHHDARQPALRFVLFDGEEAPAGFKDFYSEGARGSRAYVAAHRSSTREMILLDFIALRRQSLPRERNSDPRLWARLRLAAQRAGVGAMFPPRTQNRILDDHIPFVRAGVPAIDLIDFDYPCWQKVCDDMRQVSRQSLQATGDAVLELVRGELRRPIQASRPH